MSFDEILAASMEGDLDCTCERDDNDLCPCDSDCPLCSGSFGPCEATRLLSDSNGNLYDPIEE